MSLYEDKNMISDSDYQKLKNMTKEELNEEIRKAFGEEIYKEEVMLDRLYEIEDHLEELLGIEKIPIIFEKMKDDSRLYFDKLYIGINSEFKNDFVKCAKCVIHECRHLFQVLYISTHKDERSKRWKKEINDKDMFYYFKEIELDAFAYTKYYMKTYLNIEVLFPDSEYERIIDTYMKTKMPI